MVRLTAISPFALALAAVALPSTGCFDTANTTTAAVYPTLLTVDPHLFLGSVRCGSPGLARYVVSLVDVSVEPMGPPLNSSPPVACQNAISFGDSVVIVNHFYTARIDGYDRNDVAPDQLGSPIMRSPTGEVVLPAWTTTCGEVPPTSVEAGTGDNADAPPPYNPLRYPTQALRTAEVYVHGCVPLAANASTPDASVPDASVPDAPVDDASTPADASGEADSPEDAGTEPTDTAEPDGGHSDGDDGGGAVG